MVDQPELIAGKPPGGQSKGMDRIDCAAMREGRALLYGFRTCVKPGHLAPLTPTEKKEDRE